MRHALASRPLTGSEEGGASQLIAVSHLSPVLSLAPVNAILRSIKTSHVPEKGFRARTPQCLRAELTEGNRRSDLDMQRKT